jgi:hypothetical protein
MPSYSWTSGFLKAESLWRSFASTVCNHHHRDAGITRTGPGGTGFTATIKTTGYRVGALAVTGAPSGFTFSD